MSNEKVLTPLSASRLKTLKSCSFQYWCKYVLKLPEPSYSLATSVGGIVHEQLEYIFKDESRKYFNECTKSSSKDCELIFQAVLMETSQHGIEDQKDLVFELIDNALTYNFYGEETEKPIFSFAEKDFDLLEETEFGSFRILGFIDKIFGYKNGHAVVNDYKSSKKIFSGSDKNDNLQDQLYTLAAKRLYPEIKTANSEFLFLRFPLKDGGALKMPPVSDDEHLGLSMELADYQRAIDNFDEKSADKKLAAEMPYPSDGSFGGPLLCGYAKYPGHLKKDGITPHYHCPFKFPYDFWAIVDENGKQIKTAVLSEKHLLEEKLQEGQKIKKFHFRGCSRWN